MSSGDGGVSVGPERRVSFSSAFPNAKFAKGVTDPPPMPCPKVVAEELKKSTSAPKRALRPADSIVDQNPGLRSVIPKNLKAYIQSGAAELQKKRADSLPLLKRRESRLTVNPKDVSLHLARMERFSESDQANLLRKLDPAALRTCVQDCKDKESISKLHPATLGLLSQITGNPKAVYDTLESADSKKKFINSLSHDEFKSLLSGATEGQEKVDMCRDRVAELYDKKDKINNLLGDLTKLFQQADFQKPEDFPKHISEGMERLEALHIDTSHFKELLNVYKDNLVIVRNGLIASRQTKVDARVKEKLPGNEEKKTKILNEANAGVKREIESELKIAKNKFRDYVSSFAQIIAFNENMNDTIESCNKIFHSLQKAYNFMKENGIKDLNPKTNRQLQPLFSELSTNCKELSKKLDASFQSFMGKVLDFKLGADFASLELAETEKKSDVARPSLSHEELEDPEKLWKQMCAAVIKS